MAKKSAEIGKNRKKTIVNEMPSGIIDSLRFFAAENGLSNDQIRRIFSPEASSMIIVPENSVPVGIFSSKMGAFEAIVKYSHENLGYSFAKISKITNRSNKTVWATYNKAVKKIPWKFSVLPSSYLPLSILRDRRLGVQEAVVVYLKDDAGLNYHEIAVLLKRDDRTVWTAYNRAVKKLKSANKK